MALTKQTDINVVEILPTPDSSVPTSPSPTALRSDYFTKSEAILVAQEVGEKIAKASQENNRPQQTTTDQTQPEPQPQLQSHPETGKLSSWRGALILLITGGAMFMDNVFMTSTNISLAAIQKEFDVPSSDLQWMISAYTLSFGGFLLLSGVLSDRYGRKPMLIGGLVWLSIWTLAIGFSSSFIEMTVFRGLQGIGASLTIPSAVGIITSYFTGQERTRALGLYAASGAVGFTAGLVLGGLLSSSLGWKYIFRLSCIVSALLALLSILVLPPNNRTKGTEHARLDYFGASLSTAGLILLAFVLSGGGIYGWGKAFIIVLLVVSVGLLFAFTYCEKKISNPIMPLSLWKMRNFPSIWIVGFTVNGSFTSVLYYTVLIAQNVDGLSALDTAVRFIPSGVLGFVVTLMVTRVIESVDAKYILISGLCLSVLAPLPSCLVGSSQFWVDVMPTSFISVTGISIGYITASTLMLTSAPMNVKSLCGGMINTVYQIGGGVTLAICSAVVQAVDIDKGHDVAQQYRTGLWCTAGISGIGLLVAVFCLKNDYSASARGDHASDTKTEVLQHMA